MALEDALAQLPKLFTKTNNNTVVLAKTGGNGHLALTATTPANDCFEGRYDDGYLTKSGATDYKQFFSAMTESFNRNKCTAAAEGQDHCTLEVPGCGRFQLQRSETNGHSLMLDNIISFSKLRVSKDPDRLVEEASTKATEAMERYKSLVSEEQLMKDTIQGCQEKVEYNQARITDLQKELSALEEIKKKAAAENGEADEEIIDDEEVISRVRNPLGDKDCKDFDVGLLRVIKAQFMDFADGQVYDADAKVFQYCCIVKPYAVSEFNSIRENLPVEMQQRVYDILSHVDEWGFDVFALQETTCGSFMHEGLLEQPAGGSLFATAYALFHRYGFMQTFNLNEKIVLNWLSLVESGYHPNPYHNSMHAADVLHITHYILSGGGLIKKCNLANEDVFAALCAAIIHDYNHPGINNNYHIKVQTYLATLFNDRSILENIHVSSVFELMKMEKFNILQGFSDDQKRDIRETLVEMVLATDMGLHAKILGTFKRRLVEDHDFKKKDDIRLALSMAVKMADISNCGRDQKLYLGWCNQIADEFYMQGDRERNLGFPCSPFMDRYSPAMAKGQIAFMNYIVVPLFECISEFLPDMHFSVDLTEENKAHWTQNDDS
eukprot:TRINITY_DN31540_c0_g1_i2.p1 TRINITY_DN31540_c0_g1~~TRINITY_DN31540_c0_g1_i2.p1  ORF type:complete len:607 (+),score=264.05 TRINITY_DN31540_c0_g1_i2:106-1926(+)